jgi:hypothetical protein
VRSAHLAELVGDPQYRGFTFGGQVRYVEDDSFVPAAWPGLRLIRVCLIGGGGPGGRARATDSTFVSVGAGGSAATYAEVWISRDTLGDDPIDITIGAAGVGSAAFDDPYQAGSTLTVGGASSFGDLLTCPGGDYGRATFTGTLSIARPGVIADTATGTAADQALIVRGARGEAGFAAGSNDRCGFGTGASSPLGTGGQGANPLAATGYGDAASGYGAGGGGNGSRKNQATDLSGGDGSPGVCLVDVWY